MLLTWRSTVLTLSTSSAAISLLVTPTARWRSTCSSRSVSPCAFVLVAPEPVSSSRARSPAAPSSEKAALAASNSSDAASSSPSARHASPSSTRARAASYGAPSRRGATRGHLGRAPRLCRRGPEHAVLVALGDRVELGTRITCRFYIADGQHDLDERRQQPGALTGLRDL